MAPTPASGNQSGSNREGSDGGRNSGKCRDEITTALKAPTPPETFDAMQVEHSLARAAKTNGVTGSSSNHLPRTKFLSKLAADETRAVATTAAPSADVWKPTSLVTAAVGA